MEIPLLVSNALMQRAEGKRSDVDTEVSWSQSDVSKGKPRRAC